MKTTSTPLLHRIVFIVTFLSLCMISATVNADSDVLAAVSLSEPASAAVEETTGDIDINIVAYLPQRQNSSSSDGQIRRTAVDATARKKKRTKKIQMPARQLAKAPKEAKAPKCPKSSLCDVTIELDKCTLDDSTSIVTSMTCLEYAATITDIDDDTDPRCKRAVKYNGSVMNNAAESLTIICATARLSSTKKKDALDITSMVPDVLEAHISYEIEIFNEQNFCSDDLTGEIIVEINGGPAKKCGGTVSLTPSTPTPGKGWLAARPAARPLIPTLATEECNCSPSTDCACSMTTTECKCTDQPVAFKFKFTGGSCDDSQNQQTYWCTDKGKLLNVAHIIVTNVEESVVYFDGIVKQDQLFEVESRHNAFQEYIAVKVLSKDLHNYQKWTVAQIAKFHSNCEEPLYLGDTFGSIEINGWRNIRGSTEKCGEYAPLFATPSAPQQYAKGYLSAPPPAPRPLTPTLAAIP